MRAASPPALGSAVVRSHGTADELNARLGSAGGWGKQARRAFGACGGASFSYARERASHSGMVGLGGAQKGAQDGHGLRTRQREPPVRQGTVLARHNKGTTELARQGPHTAGELTDCHHRGALCVLCVLRARVCACVRACVCVCVCSAATAKLRRRRPGAGLYRTLVDPQPPSATGPRPASPTSQARTRPSRVPITTRGRGPA